MLDSKAGGTTDGDDTAQANVDTSDEGLSPSELRSLLLGRERLLPLDQCQYSLSFNSRALTGWMVQPSPCCAAAAVAGAYNTLLGLDRASTSAFAHSAVLDVYKDMWREQIRRKTSSLERRLGGVDAAPLVELVKARLADDHLSLGTKGITRRTIMKVVRTVVMEHPNTASESSPQSEAPLSIFTALAEFYASMADDRDKTADGAADISVVIADEEPPPGPIEDNEGGRSGGDDGEVDGGDEGKEGDTTGHEEKKDASWDWALDVYNVLKLHGSLEKLGLQRASTAPVGNMNLMRAVDVLSQGLESCRIAARVIMGKSSPRKGSCAVQVRGKDGPEQISKQWEFLRSEFMRGGQCIVLHIRNHYALLFAMREWDEAPSREAEGSSGAPCGGRRRREVLTARKGQRPRDWIDWSEIRDTLLSWEGYKIMALSRKSLADTHGGTDSDRRSM